VPVAIFVLIQAEFFFFFSGKPSGSDPLPSATFRCRLQFVVVFWLMSSLRFFFEIVSRIFLFVSGRDYLLFSGVALSRPPPTFSSTSNPQSMIHVWTSSPLPIFANPFQETVLLFDFSREPATMFFFFLLSRLVSG